MARQSGEGARTLVALEHAAALREAEKLYRAHKFGAAAGLCRKVLGRDPHHAGAHHLLGRIALDTGAGEIAVGMLGRALAVAPRSPDILTDYARAMHAEGRHAEAVSASRKALVLRPRDPKILCVLGDALLDQGKRDEALKAYRDALAAAPGHKLAAHMVTRLTGKAPEGAPQSYVADLFNSYAGTFEEHLTTTLEYRVPELVRDAVARHAPDPLGTALDIGCGTGLVAEVLRGRISAIDGIDLAPAMVEAARAKGLYRALAAGEAAATMTENPDFAGPYDLVVAGDVFVYVGDLEPIFAATSRVAAPGGLFVFSVEHVEGDEIVLRSSGRTAHGEGYIERLAERYGFVTLSVERAGLRKERVQHIEGRMTVLRARTQAEGNRA